MCSSGSPSELNCLGLWTQKSYSGECRLLVSCEITLIKLGNVLNYYDLAVF